MNINGTVILIDEADERLVAQHEWWIDSKGYVTGSVNGKRIRLHRYLLRPGSSDLVDHANRNKLDNRRCNLRIATRSQNARNSKMRSHNTSGFRGVYWCRDTQKWRAEIRVNGKGVKIGRFKSKRDAALAYDREARKRHGEFAVLNFPEFVNRENPGEVGAGCGD